MSLFDWVLAFLVLVCVILLAVIATVQVRQHASPTAQFDRYQVLRALGRGGMATVYLAKDKENGQQVALKVMDPGLVSDTDLVRKFVKEGEALQRIANGNSTAPVVKAYRYGREHDTDHGRPFVALEFLPGDTLLRVMRARGPLPVSHVVSVTRQVSEGLAAAHAHGIWHRDISPDNVIQVQPGTRTRPPTVKLIDFGVAKHEYTQARTLDGSITGKPPYMSPEQCRGEALDGRSDIYSLGIMMYTLLTGSPPFTDRNPLLVMRMHETASVPGLPASVPSEVRNIIRSMLAKDRSRRPASGAVLARQLHTLEARLSR